jgi:hypothetical protein
MKRGVGHDAFLARPGRTLATHHNRSQLPGCGRPRVTRRDRRQNLTCEILPVDAQWLGAEGSPLDAPFAVCIANLSGWRARIALRCRPPGGVAVVVGGGLQ